MFPAFPLEHFQARDRLFCGAREDGVAELLFCAEAGTGGVVALAFVGAWVEVGFRDGCGVEDGWAVNDSESINARNKPEGTSYLPHDVKALVCRLVLHFPRLHRLLLHLALHRHLFRDTRQQLRVQRQHLGRQPFDIWDRRLRDRLSGYGDYLLCAGVCGFPGFLGELG